LRTLKQTINHLYHGKSRSENQFRWLLLCIDALTISYFIVSTFLHFLAEWHWLEVTIGIYYLIEFILRTWSSKLVFREILHPTSLADLIVIMSLFAPSLAANYSFLRVARALRLLRSYHMLKTLGAQSSFVRTHEEVLFSIINLLVFIFVITAVVFVSQVDRNPGISNYVDALYFTIATLTTTGFGDITLLGTEGRILAVLIMVFGIHFFYGSFKLFSGRLGLSMNAPVVV